MKNDRQFERVLLVTDVEQYASEEDNSNLGKTSNVSLGGICITTTNNPLTIGQNYALSFKLPDRKEPIQAKGTVMWNEQYETSGIELYENGLQFLQIDEKDLDEIKKYIVKS